MKNVTNNIVLLLKKHKKGEIHMLEVLPEIVYIMVVYGLIVLFIISLTLFIRRSPTNSSKNIDEKLDRIIELLEKDKS